MKVIARDYRKLDVWKKSHELVMDVYRITSQFPRQEQYGLTSQMRRAAVSIPCNIVEGCGRGGEVELSRFLSISLGSVSELSYQLFLACELEYMNTETGQPLIAKAEGIGRMLNAFIRKLQS